MKRMISALLAAVMLLSFFPATIRAADLTATRTASFVMVDGVEKSFDAYRIDGNHYFKLRDMAYALSGTTRQFEVSWDGEKNAISLSSGQPYTVTGGEMTEAVGAQTRSAMLSASKVYLDGKEIKLTAYTIDGNNYFKLRDLGGALDFYVGWDGNSNTVEIESLFSYVPENSGNSYTYRGDVDGDDTQQNKVSNWAEVSPVQQFSYKKEGLAYAYVKDHNLVIVTPSKEWSTEMKYPRLGDVISDDEGNFYIVWGKEGTNNTEQTVFISKYSSQGQHVQTTGFVGAAKMGTDGSTKIPFNHGNCVSVITNGTLMVNYARTMYNGHQSNNVIAVHTKDMSPYQFESVIWDSNQANIPYVSHSFNQSVLYSDKAKDFIFANHGDAYGRGFIIDKLRKDMYVDYENLEYASKYPTHNLFNFYLEANADYDMYIVNKTFAQLGGLAETSKGVVLVGASAKSISEAAKTEKQNLFIQIFDPLAKELSASTFVGGTARSGATSSDINDNQNAPLTEVTDYGVIWLTSYTDRNVIAPQVVAADDRIVILWTEDHESEPSESFYMVLSAGGDVITPATSLGRRNVNSYEMPVYHNGLVYWACSYNGKLRVVSIKP